MNLLCWGSGGFARLDTASLGPIGPEEAHQREFTETRPGRVKLLACGSGHCIVITGTNPSFLVHRLLFLLRALDV